MMIPVDQTTFGRGEGNCLAACIASLLGTTLDAVPNFHKQAFESGLFHVNKEDSLVDDWLASHGLRAIRVYWPVEFTDKQLFFAEDRQPLIAWGISPRWESGKEPVYQHCVVARPNGYGLTLVHDPHPSRAGIVGSYKGCMWIVAGPGTFDALTFNIGFKQENPDYRNATLFGRSVAPGQGRKKNSPPG